MSSPTYPQSNGKAEQAVKTAKRRMERARKNNEDIYLSILDFHNTPTEGIFITRQQKVCPAVQLNDWCLEEQKPDYQQHAFS